MDGSSKFSLEFDSCFKAAIRCVGFLGSGILWMEMLEWKLDCEVGGWMGWDGM